MLLQRLNTEYMNLMKRLIEVVFFFQNNASRIQKSIILFMENPSDVVFLIFRQFCIL